MQEMLFYVRKWSRLKKSVCAQAHVCAQLPIMGLDIFSFAAVAYGVHPGDEPVSSPLCAFCVGAGMWIGVCLWFYFTLMTICALLFKQPFLSSKTAK